MNPQVDFYFAKDNQWQKAIGQLRSIVLDCGLTETLKWGCPCYQLGKSNIVLIHVFKEYCALLIFKGALLQDEHQLLIQQTENVQAARQIRFTDASQVSKQKTMIQSYIYQAIAIDKAGLKVPMKQSQELQLPEEFQQALNQQPALKKAFGALTPGRQRAYNLHFTAAKQSATRSARVEKCIPQILAGKGLND